MTSETVQLEAFLTGESRPKPVAVVQAPELGPDGKVFIRDLSLGATLRLGAMSAAAAAKGGEEGDRTRRDSMVEIFGSAVCRENGEPLFPDEALTPEDRAKVERIPMPLVARVAAAVKDRMAKATDDAKKD